MRSHVLAFLVPICASMLACGSDEAPVQSPSQQGVDASPEAGPDGAEAGSDGSDEAEVDLDAEAGACSVDAYYHPVCGADGKTYDNAEVATSCAKVAIAHDGPCEDGADPSCSVDAYALPVCGADGKTYFNPDEADCQQVAVAHYEACTTDEEGASLQDPGCPSTEPSDACSLSDTARCYYRTQGVSVPDRACRCEQDLWACEDVLRPDAG